VDKNLQGPLEKLAEALHQAIESSEAVDAALAGIRAEGFHAFLLLEVTVALGQPKEAGGDSRQLAFKDVAEEGDAAKWLVEIPPAGDARDAEGVDPLTLGASDREFLRSIRIRLDD
jgi:hypothetical protein